MILVPAERICSYVQANIKFFENGQILKQLKQAHFLIRLTRTCRM